MDISTAIILALIVGAAIYVLFIRKDHFDAYAEARRRGVQPEMIPGPKTWQTSGGDVLEAFPVINGKLCCPDCRQPTLLSGPSGGLSQNVACDNCHSEFNMGHMDEPPLIMERIGKLGAGRARVYGITPEEIAEKAS